MLWRALILSLFLSSTCWSQSSLKPQWSIGIFEGKHPSSLIDPLAISNPVLTATDVTDRNAVFVADPFLFPYKGLWYLFFEVLVRGEEHGDIGYAVSRDGKNWHYGSIVLDEPFHLSYPFVFEHAGSIYMLPETRKKQSVRLYRAAGFPLGWHHVKTLVRGNLADPSPVFFRDRWWMFAVQGGYSLVAYHSDSLFGPWMPHKKNPIYKDQKWRARPAGRPLVIDDALIRFAQDNEKRYGHQVRGFTISELSMEILREKEISPVPILKPEGTGWRGNGMHHIDAWQKPDGSWIAAVDGSGW